MSLLRKLLADAGIDETEPRNTVAGRFLSAEGVYAGPEYERISRLERWSWRDAQDLEELVDEMTARFRKPGGTERLQPMQAVALYSYIVYGRACIFANVGSGKGRVAALIPTAGNNVRPLHITFAKLQHKTIKEFRQYAEHWRISQNFKFISAERLSRAESANFLTNYDPDVVVVDECFTGDTLVDTPHGSKEIATLCVDDVITTATGPQRVEAIQHHSSVQRVDILVAGLRIATTKNHPFLTLRGWVSASELQPSDKLVQKLFGHTCLENAAVLQRRVHESLQESSERTTRAAGTLRTLSAVAGSECPLLRVNVRHEASIRERLSFAYHESRNSAKGQRRTRPVLRCESRVRARALAAVIRTYVCAQPDEEPANARENEADTKSDQPQTRPPRRQRYRAVGRTSAYARRPRPRVVFRVRDRNRRRSATSTLSQPLQDRHCATATAYCGRSRRVFASSVEAKRTRCTQDRLFGAYRLATVSSVEPQRRADLVYNLQVSGNSTYIAGGFVVHNCHLFKSPKSGRTKRMSRFLKAQPACKFVPLTGTPGDDSINNVAHIQDWVHRDGSPLPRTYNELLQWSQALDPVVTIRRAPGALENFVTDGDFTLQGIRRGVGLRVEQTPGNVFHRTSEDVACSLYLDAVKIDLPPVVEQAFEHVRQHETAPDGREFVDIQTHNALATLSLGFYRVFEEIPPKAWSEARRDWRRFLQDIISQTKYGLDTPGQVVLKIESGEIDAGDTYRNWKAIEPSFESRTVTQWVDDTTVHFARDWLHEHESVIWSPYPEFSQKVSKKSDRKFFWRQGFCGKLSIEDYDGKQGCVLSTQSNYLGRNLQDRYSKFLVFAPSARSDILEQLIGRFHRQGQRAEQVEGTFFLGSIETYEALQRARERAKFDRDNNRNGSTKLLSCDWLIPDWAEVSSWKGPRWQK